MFYERVPLFSPKTLYICSIYSSYMVTEMITLKFESNFLKQIDGHIYSKGYQSRTEFIRNAIREKIEEEQTKENLKKLAALYGSSKRKTSEKEYEKMREEGFKNFEKNFK